MSLLPRMLWIVSGVAMVAAATGNLGAAEDVGQPPGDEQSQADEQAVEVLARGPIHEAFATQVDLNPQPGPIVPKKPPEPVEEVPPEVRPEGENVVWIPGYWAWDEERQDFVWVSGIWRNAPPGRRWVPGYWKQVEGGYQWIPGAWVPADAEQLTYQPPPEESLEEGPTTPPPSEDHFWVPGCWIYYADAGCYRWRPGFWALCRPGWVWVPAYYVWTPCGVIYVPGYWDYLLVDRGLLCAPVYFYRPIYLRPGYRLMHHIVVDTSRLLLHLFVCPRWHHYFFGDYYAEVYRARGFYPWYRFHAARHGYDPLWQHYVWRNRRAGVDLPGRLHAWHEYFAKRPELRPPRTVAALGSFNRAHQDHPHARYAMLARRAAELTEAGHGRKLVRLDGGQLERTMGQTRRFRRLISERSKLETAPAAVANSREQRRPPIRALHLPRLDRAAAAGAPPLGFGEAVDRNSLRAARPFGRLSPRTEPGSGSPGAVSPSQRLVAPRSSAQQPSGRSFRAGSQGRFGDRSTRGFGSGSPLRSGAGFGRRTAPSRRPGAEKGASLPNRSLSASVAVRGNRGAMAAGPSRSFRSGLGGRSFRSDGFRGGLSRGSFTGGFRSGGFSSGGLRGSGLSGGRLGAGGFRGGGGLGGRSRR